MRILKFGLLIILSLVVATLLTLRVTGLEPGYVERGRTWYGIPHSKRWWATVERDPRVRIKIDGKLYEMTVALMADRDEIIEIFGRDPVARDVGPDGQERITSVRHYWRVFQRGIPEYGGG